MLVFAPPPPPPKGHVRWAILWLTCGGLFGQFFAFDIPSALNEQPPLPRLLWPPRRRADRGAAPHWSAQENSERERGGWAMAKGIDWLGCGRRGAERRRRSAARQGGRLMDPLRLGCLRLGSSLRRDSARFRRAAGPVDRLGGHWADMRTPPALCGEQREASMQHS